MSDFKFSKRSLSALEEVDPRLVAVARRAIEITTVDFGVIEGKRTVERQTELVASGASQTMQSKHVDGRAIDIVAYIGSRISWEGTLYDEIANAFAQAAMEQNIKIRWGGAWHIGNISTFDGSMGKATNDYVDLRRSQGKRPFLDYGHFELNSLMSIDLSTAAKLMLFSNYQSLPKWWKRKSVLPGAWRLIVEHHDKSGFDGFAFRNITCPDLVICVQGQNPFSIWDIKAIMRRRLPRHKDARYLSGGLDWIKEIVGEHTKDVTLVGHSGGGGYVSWAATQFVTPPKTICFNPARVGNAVQRTWSYKNDGKRQQVVWVRGDKWGDPGVRPKLGPTLPGKIIVLYKPAEMRPHFMETIIKALEVKYGR
jgi:peptidoglycan L-alanyl-D-glutamate endopeptidase CwlK